MVNLGVIVDGRVDRDKLLELLASEAEQEALDFKATIDFTKPRHRVEHVKDLLAMMSLSDGGYIVVGVDNAGIPAEDQEPIDPAHFDSATLLQKVMGYVDSSPSIVSAVHELKTTSGGSREVALIFAGPPPGLFPLVVKKQGEYDRPGGGKEIVFRPGQIIIRNGTTTTTLRAEFWPRLLERYAEKVKEDARRDVDALIHRFVETLSNQQDTVRAMDGAGITRSYPAIALPIDPGMDLPTFAIAADALIDSDNLPRLDRFLIQAGGQLQVGAASENYSSAHSLLNRVFMLATSAVLYGSAEQLDRILNTLVDYYNAIPDIPDAITNEAPQEQRRAAAWFEILAHLYVLGSLAVRRSKWTQLRSLTLRPYRVHETYSYASWLRHAVTSAARADVLKTGSEENLRGAPVISRALQLATNVPELRPDTPGADNVQKRLLDSLCEFDILWCVLAQSVTDRPHATDFYPSSSELDQVHANKAFVLVAEDSAARELLFPGKSDQEIGSALLYVYSRAFRQSLHHGGWWDSLPDVVQQWAEQVKATKPDPNY